MFFIALFFVILLGVFSAIVIVQNLETLVYTPIDLTVFSQHLPGAPIVLLCVLSAFLSALALYLSVVRSAHRDKKEIKELRMRVEELEKAPMRSPSGGLIANNFAPSVVPMPGFASGNQAGSGSPGPSAPPGPRQSPPNALQNPSPSATSNNLSLPPRMFPPSQQPPQQPQMGGGGPRPPFPHA